MAEQNAGAKVPLTIHLSPELAARLKAAAEGQKRPAADVVAELLDRFLPRTAGGGKKGGIPYA
jgi:hypothetical protein